MIGFPLDLQLDLDFQLDFERICNWSWSGIGVWKLDLNLIRFATGFPVKLFFGTTTNMIFGIPKRRASKFHAEWRWYRAEISVLRSIYAKSVDWKMSQFFKIEAWGVQGNHTGGPLRPALGEPGPATYSHSPVRY